MDKKHDEQLSLGLNVVVSKKINGIEMGVLQDGTPYLTERGLARFCGLSNSTLVKYSRKTLGETDSLRGAKISEILSELGFEGDSLFVWAMNKGNAVKAYTELVCMAHLEYYAFDAEEQNQTEKAKHHYRLMGRKTFRDFVYQMVGYVPHQAPNPVDKSLKNLQDRILLNSLPAGYFSVLVESYGLGFNVIKGGLEIDQYTVPDISIGQNWSICWETEALQSHHGNRVKYPHYYPDSYRQSKANGDIEAWIYPLGALGVFRKWLEEQYVPKKLPKYLGTKVKQGKIAETEVEPLLKALTPKELPRAS